MSAAQVDIYASNGLPVELTPINRLDGARGVSFRIPAYQSGTGYVDEAQSLLVRQLQPEDLRAEMTTDELQRDADRLNSRAAELELEIAQLSALAASLAAEADALRELAQATEP
jgi:hypothetical protein